MADRPKLAAIVLFVPALIAVYGVVGWAFDLPLGVDSTVYRSGGLTLLHGDSLYASGALPSEPWWALLPFTYPPTAALLFVPLALVPMQVAWGLLGARSVLSMTW